MDQATTTSASGLTAAEVAERVARGAVNVADDNTSRTLGQIVRANVFTRFNAILGAMFALIVVTGEWKDALFGIVLVVNTLIGIIQETRAKRTLDRLAVLSAPRAHVRRDGKVQEIDVDDIRASYAQAEIAVLLTSATRGSGVDELREQLRGKVSALYGGSGVGKSSLLNALQPSLGLKTGKVSKYWDAGKHTTTHSQLLQLDLVVKF